MEVLYVSQDVCVGNRNQAYNSQWWPLMLPPRVKNVRMILDVSLTTEVQVFSVPRLAFYHLWLVRQLVPYLPSQDFAIVIHGSLAMVTRKLDYCNSVYAGLPFNLIWTLQLVLHGNVSVGAHLANAAPVGTCCQ